ncbi:IclR family transcriptional regulator [Paenibacillus humicola]|uniref:IclR family transcriptional regulator n=1 Tax=Paenibacillus humicola TaxID=3110540 RepID=UPI00237B1490|nr:IclR family transcriptional regulator [Paenibacillus humicola]
MPIIQALDRSLKIIDLFDEQNRELKITDISRQMNLHKSTVHSLLKTLQLHGYIDQDEETGKYRLGIRLVEKGQLVLQGLDIRQAAKPHLHRLSEQSGQTAHLVVLDRAEGVYIDKVEGDKAVIRYSRIGRRVSLHSSAVGKVLAAFQPPETLARLLEGYVYSRLTPNTIGSEREFLAEIERVRASGIAYDNEENEPGVRCAAAPILDHNGHAAAAISISTLLSHVDDAMMERCVELLLEETGRISAQLGYRRRG